jgi:hypothetical protein
VDRQPSTAVVHAAGADALLVARQQGYEIDVRHQHCLAASEIADGNQVAPLRCCGGYAAMPSGKVCSMAVCGALCSARRRHSVCQRAPKVTKVRWQTCTGAPKIYSAEARSSAGPGAPPSPAAVGPTLLITANAQSVWQIPSGYRCRRCDLMSSCRTRGLPDHSTLSTVRRLMLPLILTICNVTCALPARVCWKLYQ